MASLRSVNTATPSKYLDVHIHRFKFAYSLERRRCAAEIVAQPTLHNTLNRCVVRCHSALSLFEHSLAAYSSSSEVIKRQYIK